MDYFNRESKNIYANIQSRFGIIGNSDKIQDALQKLVQAAPTDLTILVNGETGTGKEVFANAIHGLSKRNKRPFLSINCGAIPETLLESELFGHEKGAFTGATQQRKGYFEVADKGTILLDEIGEMPIGTQVKLLRVLESGEFTRLGSTDIQKVDVRIIAATNRDLEIEVEEGNFRRDLFFRLKSVQIILPPLREHSEDLDELVKFFGQKAAEKNGMDFQGIAYEALNLLKTLPWPGNIRELKHMIETIVTLENTTYITSDLLQPYLPAALPAPVQKVIPDQESMIHIPQSEFGSNEFNLIFRSLLEIKNEISDLKSAIHMSAVAINKLNTQIEDLSISNAQEYNPEENLPDEEDDLRLENMEIRLIVRALKKANGNRRIAAEELGISQRTLYRKISEYNLTGF